MCCFEYFVHGYTIVYTSIVLYRPCFTVVCLVVVFYSAQKQLWSSCFELTVEVLDTAVTQALSYSSCSCLSCAFVFH